MGAYNVATSGDQYKLIARYIDGIVQYYKLYDIIKNLGERTDLSQKYPSISNELLTKIESWRKSVMDSAHKVGCLMNN